MPYAFVPYPAIERHGVIGDRRTAALTASDGTIDWLCLPDYDGHVVFGAMLDAARGGFWRAGPASLLSGEQRYRDAAPFVATRWSTGEYELELLDAMALPNNRDGADAAARVLLRRLTCTRGSVECVSSFAPSFDFAPFDPRLRRFPSGDTFVHWCSDASLGEPHGARGLERGDVVWMALAIGVGGEWSVARAEYLLADAERFWADAVSIFCSAAIDPRIIRSAVTIRMLEYAPAGSIVAAPTTSVPERIGGGWNADYRLTWIRDASLSIETLAVLGDLVSARRFFQWLTTLESARDEPLQVLYGIRGETEPRQHERSDLDGFRGSPPIRFGNHAYRQHQHDKFGYLARCVLAYLESGGEWDPRLWDLLVRVADAVCEHWSEPGNGIWELASREHYVSSQVMSWAALDAIVRIGERGRVPLPRRTNWERARDAIHDEVLRRGWSESHRAFKRSLEVDALDASALLIPIVGFLPPSDPRVVSTITQIAERLTIDGCVYRFDPLQVPKMGDLPMGEYEGAFLPCTFWLATAMAILGRRRDAEDILRRADGVAGPLGLFAEGLDPRSRSFLGNTPLLFSHVEYVRAVCALNRA